MPRPVLPRSLRRLPATCLALLCCVWLVRTVSLVEVSASTRAMLPEAIATTGIVTTSSTCDTMCRLRRLVSGDRRTITDTTVFELTTETAAAIRARGMAFFDDARDARGYPLGHLMHDQFAYTPWRQPPTPWGTGLIPADSGLDQDLVEAITHAAQEPDTYSTTNYCGVTLTVIPRKRLVVLTYPG